MEKFQNNLNNNIPMINPTIRDSHFRYNNLFSETNYSDYRRERDMFLNSLNNNINNISTSLSSFDKYPNSSIYYNNPYRSSNNRSRSRSPCFCGCHSHEEHINALKNIDDFHNSNIYPREQMLQNYNNSLANINQEMNKKNDDLINEIISLKKNLEKVENELTRTKNEKDACDSYIIELEKELSKSNTNDELMNSKRRALNYSKMRDYEKYHTMLNKSFEVLDSVSNKCNDPKGKTKGGVNYYINRDKDYNTVIKTQKNWVDNLPISNEYSKNRSYNRPKTENGYNFNNNNDIDDNMENESEVYKYPEGYVNLSMKDYKNKGPYNLDNYSQNNKYPKRYYNSGQGHLNYNSNSMPKNISQINNKKRNSPYQSDFFQKHIMYKNTQPKTTKGKNTIYRNNSESNIPKKNNTFPYYSNSNLNNINENYPSENPLNNNENNYSPETERYLVLDKLGNPIYIPKKRLTAMKIIPILDEEGNEQYDSNGNLIFKGPDGKPKTQEDLQPIILGNDKPLVNEENRPFLGIDDVIMVNRFGEPILGPGELYDINNKVVKGELGILPKNNKGNLIIFDMNEDPLIKNIEKNGNDNTDKFPNTIINSNDYNTNYKSPKPEFDKTNKDNINNQKDNDDNNNIIPLKIKPLIGKDGKPIRDKNNKPILLDKNGNIIEDPDYKLLLDKSGFPVLNTLGVPIILDKDNIPLNIENKNIPKDNYKKKKGKNAKRNKNKSKIDNLNDNKETGRFNYNPLGNNIYNKNKKSYPKLNRSFQRKLNILPERSNRFNPKQYFSTCFACDLGCSVSRSGYSPMNYSPYDNKIRRRDLTPYK